MSPFKAVSLKGGLQGFVYLEETTTKKNIAKGTTDPRIEFILPK